MSGHNTLKTVASSLALAVTAISGTSCFAQEQDREESRSSADAINGDIVVTAEKRNVARSVQVVPAAVSALSGEAVEALRLDNVSDIGSTMPNVRLQSVGTVPGVANFSIRGIGLNSSVPSDEPTVGIVMDGVPLAVTYGAYLDTFDLEQVEVLRGPQGTLFGRNATGGAILLRSRRPDGHFGFRARLIAGSNEMISGAGAIEGTIAGDQLFGKLAVLYESHDGYFKNGAIPGDKIGERNSLLVRPSLVWEPSSATKITLIGEYGDTKGDGSLVKPTDRAGDLAYRLGFHPSTDKMTLYANPEGRNRTRWYQGTLDASFELGSGTLTSITGYRDSKLEFGDFSLAGPTNTDNDGTPLNIFNLANLVDQWQVSEELRYAGTAFDDKLSYTLGAFYLHQNLAFQEARLVAGALGAAPIATKSALSQESLGVFGQLEYELAPSVFVLGGGRYSWDQKKVDIFSFGQCNAVLTCTGGFSQKKSFSDFSPKLGLRWEATRDVMAYATYTKGFRSGGYNFRNTAPASPGPYGDESVTAYEFGIKGEFADRRVRANLALFRNDYDDIQRTVLVSATEQNVTNAASARVQGIELDLTVNPVDALVLTASAGYLDAKFKRFNGLDVNGDRIPDPELARHLAIERAPELTYTLGAIYDLRMGDAGTLTFRGNYSFTDKTAINTVNTSFLPAFGLLNASATFAFADRRTSVTVFGKNLTNRVYGVTGADIPGFARSTYLEAPRTWGVELRYEY